MSMGEIAYEIRQHVDIMVGAEGLEPQFGWPYRRILVAAKDHRGTRNRPMAPRELATAIVKEYVKYYSDYDRTAGRSIDLAAIDVRKISALKDTFRGLVSALHDRDLQGRGRQDDEALVREIRYDPARRPSARIALGARKARNKLDSTGSPMKSCSWPTGTPRRTSPINSSTSRTSASRSRSSFRREGQRSQNQVHGCHRALWACIITSGCSGFACQYSYGLSVYFPWGCVSPDYDNLAFRRHPVARLRLETCRSDSASSQGFPRPSSTSRASTC